MILSFTLNSREYVPTDKEHQISFIKNEMKS